MRTLLLGLGNDIRSDDAVGLVVAREVKKWLPESSPVEVQESSEMGMALLDFIVGYDTVVLVDAVQTGKAPAGFVHKLEISDLKLLPSASPHYAGITEVIALGQAVGLPMPNAIDIFAIEVNDPFTLGCSMTPEVESAVAEAADRIIEFLEAAAVQNP